MDKSTAVLFIYDTLTNEKPLTISELCETCDCSRRTAIRYIKNVRSYLQDYLNQPISYDRKKKTFFIAKEKKD